MFENEVPRKIFGSQREEAAGGGEMWVMRSFIICSLHKLLR
jgi:hypothetical protein